jgi:hypothetical protein
MSTMAARGKICPSDFSLQEKIFHPGEENVLKCNKKNCTGFADPPTQSSIHNLCQVARSQDQNPKFDSTVLIIGDSTTFWDDAP